MTDNSLAARLSQLVEEMNMILAMRECADTCTTYSGKTHTLGCLMAENRGVLRAADQRCAELEAENARLRAALERIAAETFVPLDQLPDDNQPNGWRDIAIQRIDIAYEALGGTDAE